MPENIWKNTRHKNDRPTMESPVTQSSDILFHRAGVCLEISHVEGFYGKGFKPVLTSRGYTQTGEVYYGEGLEAYAEAGEELFGMLFSWQQERAEIEKKIEKEQAALQEKGGEG